jgi:hypothetical protein
MSVNLWNLCLIIFVSVSGYSIILCNLSDNLIRNGTLKVQVSPTTPFAEAISLANISSVMSCCLPVVEPLIRILSPILISFYSIKNWTILGFEKW